MKHTKCYIKGYPRPQFVRNEFCLLDGEWHFSFDKCNVGETQKWYKTFPVSTKIIVPYPYQAKASGITAEESCEVVWYRRKASFISGKRVILNFEGSDYFTKVWVNGQLAGSNEGGYHRFSMDITDYLVGGEAEIIVRAEDTFDATQPRGKQRLKDQNYACWYTEVSGIWKSVWAEYVSANHIQRVEYATEHNSYTLRCDYYLNAKDLDLAKNSLYLRTTVELDGNKIIDSTQLVTKQYISSVYDVRSDFEPFKVHQWSEHSPKLYDINFELIQDGKTVDSVGSYFGFTDYKCYNNHITNNSFPMYLKMILDQGYFEDGLLTATEQELLKDIQLVKEVGLNGIRKHQKIESDIFYYYCDILGVYCWLEMPSPYDYNSVSLERMNRQWIQIVRDHISHPSIMALVPFNESWGVPQILTNKSQQAFVESIYHTTKALAPSKLVVGNDGWEHAKTDILTLHHYGETGKVLQNAFEDMDSILSGKTTRELHTKLPFVQGYNYTGQPIIISEFAGIAFAQDKGGNKWGYGAMVEGETAFIARLEGLVSYIRSIPSCSGYCITQMTDVMQEVNGLWTINREYKVDKKELKRIINK